MLSLIIVTPPYVTLEQIGGYPTAPPPGPFGFSPAALHREHHRAAIRERAHQRESSSASLSSGPAFTDSAAAQTDTTS